VSAEKERRERAAQGTLTESEKDAVRRTSEQRETNENSQSATNR